MYKMAKYNFMDNQAILKPQTTRSLKIQSRYKERIAVPELKLQGLWLEAVGFKAGGRVVVEIKDQELIIKPA